MLRRETRLTPFLRSLALVLSVLVGSAALAAAALSAAALVIGQALPEAQSRPAAAIKAALTTIAIRPPLAIEDQVSALPFRLTERAGFRPVRAMAGNALFLTDGVKDVVVGAEQPIAIVA